MDDTEALERVYRARVVKAFDWITDKVSEMAKEGKSAKSVSEELAYLQEAAERWRHQDRFLPSMDPPWEWNKKDLEKFISDSKANSYYPSEEFPGDD
jgi:hypothetical protein